MNLYRASNEKRLKYQWRSRGRPGTQTLGAHQHSLFNHLKTCF